MATTLLLSCARNARSFSLFIAALFGIALFFLGCNSSCSFSPSNATVRAYNGTASVGDFLTISIDSGSHTITYDNVTNGESGTVPYTVNSDGSYTITDPNGNLLSAYEVPGYVMVVEAANAGPNRDTAALITAIQSVSVTLQTFAAKNFNMTQFRTRDGGVEIGTVTIDALKTLCPILATAYLRFAPPRPLCTRMYSLPSRAMPLSSRVSRPRCHSRTTAPTPTSMESV